VAGSSVAASGQKGNGTREPSSCSSLKPVIVLRAGFTAMISSSRTRANPSDMVVRIAPERSASACSWATR
jgi:hypothetical protein